MDPNSAPNFSNQKQGKVRIYVVQRCPRILDLEHGVQTAIEEIATAAKAGANLITFPETWLTGYPAWVFGMASWNDPEARSWYKGLVEANPTASSSHISRIRDSARENNVEVILGFNERARETGGTIYNSVGMIGRDGSLRGVHRKLTPTHAERLIWANGDAQGLKAYDTSSGRIGAAALHNEDEQIHIALWPDMPSAHQIASREYAFEGRCFVVAAASYLDNESVPPELLEAYVKGAGSTDLFIGGSSVIGPDG
ncbi:hydrolase, carbon-nitrogen family protein [Fusarium oxysporum]|nr:hydrolase, carbon-nitrogen family protein [Fusarium oxysporum]